MNRTRDQSRTVGSIDAAERSAAGRPSRATGVLYGLGLVVTIAGLGYVLADQVAIGGLARHLHHVYDAYGKDAPTGPLYGYLYVVGALGLACWLLCLRLVRAGARKARWLGIVIAVLALFAVLPPLVVQEYGQLVIPVQLGIGYAAAWLLGVVGLLMYRRTAGAGKS